MAAALSELRHVHLARLLAYHAFCGRVRHEKAIPGAEDGSSYRFKQTVDYRRLVILTIALAFAYAALLMRRFWRRLSQL